MVSASSSYYTNKPGAYGYQYKYYISFSPTAASSKKVVQTAGQHSGMHHSKSDTSLSAAAGVAKRSFSPELFARPVKLINSHPPVEKKESKGEEKAEFKHPQASAPGVATAKAAKSVSASSPASVPAKQVVVAALSQKTQAASVASRMQATSKLHPAQIQSLLTKAGNGSDVLTVWVDHNAKFDAGNYSTIFAKFTQLQSKKKHANDGNTDVLRGMVRGVIDCINDFRYLELSKTIGCFEKIKCSGSKLTRTFEKYIMEDKGAGLADFDTETISGIASSYAYHRIGGLAVEDFLVLLNTEVTQYRDPDADALGSMLKAFSKIGLKSSGLKIAFKTTQAKITEGGASLLKDASLESVATMAHALITSQKDSRKELLAMEKAIMTGSKSGGCVLSDWVQEDTFSSNFSKILHAFAKQGVGSEGLYKAIEASLTDDVISTFELTDLINISWALAFAGRFDAEALPTMMGLLVIAYKNGALDLTGAEGKNLLEKLSWTKLSLTYEQKSEFEWAELGVAIDAYKSKEPSGSITQTAVCEAFKNIYGKDHVHEEYRFKGLGLDVDIFIDRKDKKSGVATEVLGPHHYEDGANCGVLNAQTKFRLRLLCAIFGPESVATISTKQWDRQPGLALATVQKLVA